MPVYHPIDRSTIRSNIQIEGFVLETYGIGNGPSKDQHLLKVLKDAVVDGKVIVTCSRCLKGTVRLEAYRTGCAFAEIGLISGNDMTTEAAMVNMGHLFVREDSHRAVKQSIPKNL